MDNQPVGNLGGGEIILTAKILPIYVGAVNSLGQEPMSDSAYQRGTLVWDVMPNDEILGRARIMVPAGTWRWLIYAHHPTAPAFVYAEKLANDMVFSGAAAIDLDCINSAAIIDRPGVLPD